MKHMMQEQIRMLTKGMEPNKVPDLIIEANEDRLVDVVPLLINRGLIASELTFGVMMESGDILLNGEREIDICWVLACNDILELGRDNYIRIVK